MTNKLDQNLLWDAVLQDTPYASSHATGSLDGAPAGKMIGLIKTESGFQPWSSSKPEHLDYDEIDALSDDLRQNAGVSLDGVDIEVDIGEGDMYPGMVGTYYIFLVNEKMLRVNPNIVKKNMKAGFEQAVKKANSIIERHKKAKMSGSKVTEYNSNIRRIKELAGMPINEAATELYLVIDSDGDAAWLSDGYESALDLIGLDDPDYREVGHIFSAEDYPVVIEIWEQAYKEDRHTLRNANGIGVDVITLTPEEAKELFKAGIKVTPSEMFDEGYEALAGNGEDESYDESAEQVNEMGPDALNYAIVDIRNSMGECLEKLRQLTVEMGIDDDPSVERTLSDMQTLLDDLDMMG